MTGMDAYRQVQINTADRVRIITLLFDGAVNFMRMALEAMKDGDVVQKGVCIGKATSIIGELSSSLDMKKGGEIAANLKRLYDFVLDRLFYANLKNDKDALEVAMRVVDVLRQGWKEMERVDASVEVGGARQEMEVRA